MKDQKNPNPGANSDGNTGKKTGSTSDVNTGKKTGTEQNPDTKKTAETKTKGNEVWKDPDPTTPERKNDPDPTKPEKQEGPFGNDTKQKNPTGKKNPASPEVNSDSDEEIGSLEEQDIDDQGITGEAKDDNDFEGDASHRKSA